MRRRWLYVEFGKLIIPTQSAGVHGVNGERLSSDTDRPYTVGERKKNVKYVYPDISPIRSSFAFHDQYNCSVQFEAVLSSWEKNHNKCRTTKNTFPAKKEDNSQL